MKKILSILLFLTISLQAQLSLISSYPENGSTAIGLNDTLYVTFNVALDTADIKIGKSIFTNIISDTEVWLSEDFKTIYFAPTLEENKNYFILFYGTKAEDGSYLAEPFVIQFTTATVFSGYTVSGTVSFKDTTISPENTLIALLGKKLGNEEPQILYANISDNSGEFAIEHVPNGMYYPIAVKDINEDGEIDPGNGDVLAKGDSIIVNDADINGIELLLEKLERVKFAKAKAIVDSLKNGMFFRNLKLYYVNAWKVDSAYRAGEWEFLYQNTLTQQLYRVLVNAEGNDVQELQGNIFNWIRNFRALGDSISFAAEPDSFIAKVERRVGRALRHRNLPDSLELEVQLSLGDISKDGFWNIVPDTAKFYWGLRYRIRNKNKNQEDNVLAKSTDITEEEEHLFIADYKTGEEVEVTGVVERTNELPGSYKLEQNYPNPFNPTTVISYQIPNSEFVTLKVYNILGKEITTLVNRNQTSGSYKINFNASNLTSGIYFYQITAGDFTKVHKMMLLK